MRPLLGALSRWLLGTAAPGEVAPPAPNPTIDARAAHERRCRLELEAFLSTRAELRFVEAGKPEVSVLLVLHGRAELTLRCLRSLLEVGGISLEVIVFDNASGDETPALLGRLRGATVVRSPENLGFLRAVNEAARLARGRELLLLNNDAELLPGSLDAALRTLRSAPDVGAVVGRLILSDGRLQEAGSIVWSDGHCLGYGRAESPVAPEHMFRRDVDYGSAAFLLTPRAVFEQLGGFDEAYRPAYYEDSDFCLRVWAGGRRVVYEPEAAVLHLEFGSAASSAEAIRMQEERRALFAERHRGRLSAHCAPSPDHVLEARAARRDRPRILLLDDRVPHASLGSGFPRSREILLSLLELRWHVTLYPLSFFREGWDEAYADIPREVEIMLGRGIPGLARFLAERRRHYQRILVSRDHNLRLLGEAFREVVPEGAGLVYDSEAVVAPRKVAERELRGERVPQAERERLLRDELSLARIADSVIAVSPADAHCFETAGLAPPFVVGHALGQAPTEPAFDERSGLLFVGAIHEEGSPNADAVLWLATEILPRIRAMLGADLRLTVVGPNASERVAALEAPGLELLGRVRDLVPLYASARLFVAPTRFAAGLPFKLHHAAAHGLPIVCTSLLAGQVGWADGRELLVADDAGTFAARCAAAYRDAGLWRSLRANALAAVGRDCSREVFRSSLAAALRAAEPRPA